MKTKKLTNGLLAVSLVFTTLLSSSCIGNGREEPTPPPIITPPDQITFNAVEINESVENGGIAYRYVAFYEGDDNSKGIYKDLEAMDDFEKPHFGQDVYFYNYKRQGDNEIKIVSTTMVGNEKIEEDLSQLSFLLDAQKNPLSMTVKALSTDPKSSKAKALQNATFTYDADVLSGIKTEDLDLKLEWDATKKILKKLVYKIKESDLITKNKEIRFTYTIDDPQFSAVKNPKPGIFWAVAPLFQLKANEFPLFVEKLLHFLPEPDKLPVKVLITDNDKKTEINLGYQWIKENNFQVSTHTTTSGGFSSGLRTNRYYNVFTVKAKDK